MKIRRAASKKARIEIIPMIDVIFFLLVFFMVSSLAMTKINSLPVALPQVTGQPAANRPKVVLTIKKDGDIWVNRTSASLATLGDILIGAMNGHSQDVVVVNADKSVSYGMVVQAMDRARHVGVRKFALATEAVAR